MRRAFSTTAALCGLCAVVLTTQTAAAPDQLRGWQVEKGPYLTDETPPKQVVLLHDSDGRKATIIRYRTQRGKDDQAPEGAGKGWLPLRLPRTRWALVLASTWGSTVSAAGRGWRYQMTVQGKDVGITAIAGAWATGQWAYRMVTNASRVSEVHSKPPSELKDEIWLGALEDLKSEPVPRWFVKPDGLVKSAVLAKAVDQGKAEGVTKRFVGPVQQVCYLAELSRFRGSPQIAVRWFEGGKVVAARQMTVYGGAKVWGSLTASGGDGLAAGNYALEIDSADGEEARLDFVIEPGTKQ